MSVGPICDKHNTHTHTHTLTSTPKKHKRMMQHRGYKAEVNMLRVHHVIAPIQSQYEPYPCYVDTKPLDFRDSVLFHVNINNYPPSRRI